MQAMQHSIQVRTAVGQRLLNRLLHEGSRVFFMQAKDADELLDPAAPFWPSLAQPPQHPTVTLWPACLPFFQRSCIVEGTWSLLKQAEIVQGLEEILLTLVAAGVTRKPRRAIQDLQVEGVRFHDHISPGAVDWHRVTVFS